VSATDSARGQRRRRCDHVIPNSSITGNERPPSLDARRRPQHPTEPRVPAGLFPAVSRPPERFRRLALHPHLNINSGSMSMPFSIKLPFRAALIEMTSLNIAHLTYLSLYRLGVGEQGHGTERHCRESWNPGSGVPGEARVGRYLGHSLRMLRPAVGDGRAAAVDPTDAPLVGQQGGTLGHFSEQSSWEGQALDCICRFGPAILRWPPGRAELWLRRSCAVDLLSPVRL